MSAIEKFIEWAEHYDWGNRNFLTKARQLAGEEREPVKQESLAVLELVGNIAHEHGFRTRVEFNGAGWEANFIPFDIESDNGPKLSSWISLKNMLTEARQCLESLPDTKGPKL